VQDDVSLAQGSCEDGDETLGCIELGLEHDVNVRPWRIKVVDREIKL